MTEDKSQLLTSSLEQQPTFLENGPNIGLAHSANSSKPSLYTGSPSVLQLRVIDHMLGVTLAYSIPRSTKRLQLFHRKCAEMRALPH